MIKQLLEALARHFESTRGAGHTTAMFQGAAARGAEADEGSSVFVILAQRREAEGIQIAPKRPKGVRYVSLDDVRQDLLRGARTAGTVFDNHALMVLFENVLTEFARNEREIEHLKKQVAKADQAVLGLKVQLTRSALRRIEFAQETARLTWAQGNDVY